MATPRHGDKGPRKIDVQLPTAGSISIYSNQKVRNALEEIQEDMTFYKGVRLMQVIEAVYMQGQKDGATSVVDQLVGHAETLRPPKIGRRRKRR